MHRLRTSLAALAIASVVAFGADAQTKYPHATVTLVTHSSPGGGSDVFLRTLARFLGPKMGTNFVVENVRGGSGARAVARVAQAPADGSVFYATTPTYIQTTLLSKPEFGHDSLMPVVIVFLDPEVIYTRTQSPHQSLSAAIDHAKHGGRVRWGAANPASLERIALERLNKLTGARAAVVSHEGGGDLMVNVLNGTLDIGIGEIQELRAQLDSNQVRLLAVLTERRLADLPDLPTAHEQGLDLVVTKFRGLAGPKNIPPATIKLLEDGVEAVLADPEYKKEYARENLIPTFMRHEEAQRFTAKFTEEVSASLR
ncbi:MAG TPA: tripartite tricarboxylate transporter substrate binding protein, partial [Alphaproteobacteria bacterium]|nr:tripartite tricarboxylate transporter substrate binding protein [Alphaproteobacteria bacterium]